MQNCYQSRLSHIYLNDQWGNDRHFQGPRTLISVTSLILLPVAHLQNNCALLFERSGYSKGSNTRPIAGRRLLPGGSGWRPDQRAYCAGCTLQQRAVPHRITIQEKPAPLSITTNLLQYRLLFSVTKMGYLEYWWASLANSLTLTTLNLTA